jgi:hypothetical protein
MNADDVRFYRDRWKAVEEIERQELRAMSFDERWGKINSLAQFAFEHGLRRKDDDGEMEVFKLWARLKEQHETS